MLFNSLQYVIFLPIVLILYRILLRKVRWVLMLVASYYFYMSWNAKYVVLILFTTGISYGAGLLLEKQEKKGLKRLIVGVSAGLCIAVLFFFKYFNFFFDSLTAVLSLVSIKLSPPTLKLLLPVGISFYTFQTVGYIVDVYRGNTRAERNFGIYATFVSFFPQLVAGPIERTSNLLPQIKDPAPFDTDDTMAGLKLLLIGYFKKLVIADNIAGIVDTVYASPAEFTGVNLLVAAVLFAFQIYCDFSGYSDIAIGSAKLMGIDLMTNFKAPYYSASIREFWSRWHISLSTWFRDYVYIPLGGSRCSKFRQCLNRMITFLLSGLWHGANWTFVVWGALHGLADVFETLFRKGLDRIRKIGVIRVLLTIVVFAFTVVAWIFFRAGSLKDAWYVLTHLFENAGQIKAYFDGLSVVTFVDLALIFGYILVLAVYDLLVYRESKIVVSQKKYKVVRWAFFIVIALLLAFASPKGVPSAFVYFQF